MEHFYLLNHADHYRGQITEEGCEQIDSLSKRLRVGGHENIRFVYSPQFRSNDTMIKLLDSARDLSKKSNCFKEPLLCTPWEYIYEQALSVKCPLDLETIERFVLTLGSGVCDELDGVMSKHFSGNEFQHPDVVVAIAHESAVLFYGAHAHRNLLGKPIEQVPPDGLLEGLYFNIKEKVCTRLSN